MRSSCICLAGLFIILSCISYAASSSNKCVVHPYDIRFFRSLLLESNYLDDFQKTTGKDGDSLALKFNGTHGLVVTDPELPFLKKLHRRSCRNNEFVFHVTVKFERLSERNPIFFLNNRDESPFSIEFQSTNQTLIFCFVNGGTTFFVSIPFAPVDTVSWYNIAVVFSGRTLTVYVNCKKIGDRIIKLPEYCFPLDSTFHFGEPPFKGYMQDIGISFRENAIKSFCPDVQPACKNSGPYLLAENTIATLNDEILELKQEINRLENKPIEYPMFVCFVDGFPFEPNTFFKSLKNEICFCSMGGTVLCTAPDKIARPPTPAPPITPGGNTGTGGACTQTLDGVEISVPVGQTSISSLSSPDGQWCVAKKCRSQNFLGRTFLVMDSLDTYNCLDYKHLKTCATATNLTKEEGDIAICCGFCNVCELPHECHDEAKCKPYGSSDYVCECNRGFIGDGIKCDDLNECANGYIAEYGHYCPFDAKCVDTRGGFDCVCPSGYKFIDRKGYDSTCEDIDECENDVCKSSNSQCKNTVGSYECVCEDGYVNQGDECVANCDPACTNGGTCVDPNVCSCPEGVNGTHCEIDIDECTTGVHDCDVNAECVNLYHGYFCTCRPGFRGSGTTCRDIDECNEWTHDCIGTSVCINTVGSYMCNCTVQSGKVENCRGWCIWDRKSTWIPNNSHFLRGGNKCFNCTCEDSVLTCPRVECDCSLANYDRSCCGHCSNEKRECTVDGNTVASGRNVTDANDKCVIHKCQDGKVTTIDNNCKLSYPCPDQLIDETEDGCCKQCQVERCTAQNDGKGIEINNGCERCDCEDGEWTCASKTLNCPAVDCVGGSMVMNNCCTVCDGSVPQLVPFLPVSGTTSEVIVEQDVDIC